MFANLGMHLFDEISDFDTLVNKIRYTKSKCFAPKVK